MSDPYNSGAGALPPPMPAPRRMPPAALGDAMVTTAFELPGYRVVQVHGEVFGITVRARNAFSNMGAGFRTMFGGEAKGYTKLTKTLPQDYAYKLNGLDQYMVGKISGTGSLVSAAHAALTLQVTVTLNAIPQDFNPNGGGFYWGFAAYRGTGVTKDASFSVGNTRYAIGVSVDTTTTVKTLRAMFIGSDGLTIWTWPHSVALELGKHGLAEEGGAHALQLGGRIARTQAPQQDRRDLAHPLGLRRNRSAGGIIAPVMRSEA